MLTSEIRKILLFLYPNDASFIDIIISPDRDLQFFTKISKWIEDNEMKNNINSPFNKLYGISDILSKNQKMNSSSFNFTKTTIDTFYNIVKTNLLSNEEISLKEKLINAFNIADITSINFVNETNETNNSKNLPINFYAFAICIRVLYEFSYEHIDNYSIGIFDIFNNDAFYTDLFSGYILFLYFFTLSSNIHKALSFSFVDDFEIYEPYTFHIDELGELSQLSKYFQSDIFSLCSSLFNLKSVSNIKINVFRNISEEEKSNLISFIQQQTKIKNLTINADVSFIDKFDISSLKSSSVNINILSNNKKNELCLTENDECTIKHLFLQGDNIIIKKVPKWFNELRSFEFISENERTEDGMSLTKETFSKMKKLNKLTLKCISYSQFKQIFDLKESAFDNLERLYLTIDNSKEKKEERLSYVKLIEHIIEVNPKLKVIKIQIDNTKNEIPSFFISKQNGIYLINKVLQNLKSCSIFSVTNHVNTSENCKKIIFSDKNILSLDRLAEEEVIEDESSNHTGVYYYVNSNKAQDKKLLFENDTFYSFLIVILNKIPKLKPKPILRLLFKYLTDVKGKMYLVANYNN